MMDRHVEGMVRLKGPKFPYNEAGEILREAVAGTLKMPESYAIQAAPAEGNLREAGQMYHCLNRRVGGR